ncbi:hypothetical protein [Sphingomonas hankyongi]|uniref:Lipoprotein n=1 Tax=Sphingomonas hankyongi TaxID=2908209 RepID=A0ABT0RYJ1_9SPHN|nr:hypothetical protein [Sphingomonas hankyongi]MCL6728680.1 hypothetical protein [Sphingomonas hankyongi]
MRKTFVAALAATSILVLSACNKQPAPDENAAAENAGTETAAAGDINGTWVADLASVQIDTRPDEILVQNGQYECKTCTPPYKVAADGAFHPVSGQPYFDSASVKVVDDKTIQRTGKKGDRVTGDSTTSVSADGNTLTVSFNDSSIENAPVVKGSYTETRVGPAPAGAHAVSGQWKPAKIENVSAEGLTTTYALDGDTLHMSSPSGVSFDAKLDGTDTPIKGDPAGTMASVKKVGEGYEETDKRDGKVVGVSTFSVGADGKLNVVYENKLDGSKTTYSANKQ